MTYSFGNELPPLDPEFFREHVAHTGTVRVAAFLLAYVIGRGNLWTIEQMERLVAETTPYSGSQKRVELDRRIRQLPVVGWVSTNYRSEPGLRASQHRLVTIGAHVWNVNFRFPKGHSCSGRLRRETLAAAGYACEECGIAKGDLHPDGHPARMTIGRIKPGSAGGLYEPDNVRCECDVCNESSRDLYDWGSIAVGSSW